jgi:catechol 2,3-dioxygenase-like lactoylglutathione lyase family enzyme
MSEIHHVTAIAGDPQRNLDFYAGVLGLRLVKLTVNFDDPGTYHFYYGDERGRPGTILTFFTWPQSPRGRTGLGQTAAVTLAVPPAAISFWLQRLIHHGVPFKGPLSRFGESLLELTDPDGMPVELVGTAQVESVEGWSGGPVPGESAIRGLHSATLLEAELSPTSEVLTEILGFRAAGSEDMYHRFVGAGDGPGRVILVRAVGGFWSGAMGVGAIHHVAYRAKDDEAQLDRRNALVARGTPVTAVLDRKYFHSIYFPEPGGVLFEIATDQPGFTVDEPLERLGSELKLPPWLEPELELIRSRLTPLELPAPEKTRGTGAPPG